MAMRAEEWQKIEELLDAALELAPAERRKFLDEASGGAPELRRAVESLLACEAQIDGFLVTPALAFSADFFDDNDAPDARVGQEIGHYRIIREIGRGGMGTVFLVERADGEFEQQVALKIVRRSFADADLTRRFRRERQILASLDHPNIARLLDGGVSDSDEPFLVMEYVKGVRIDDYCDGRDLSTSERLRLFLKVCRGVSYAHQHLVVHRDIKPSNILVVEDEQGKPTPKLLDFGIAKLLDPEQSGEHTQTEMRAFTPDYASPEQVSGAPVTTASDVYSLGVLLRDLLHAARPSPDARKAPGGWRSETPAQKTIATNLPTKQKDDDKRAKINLRKYASAELGNIITMARREDPARRYASAAQLAEDVQRYLDGQPVHAQKDSFTYRAGKFVRRNKVGVAATVIILLSLVGGIIATVWQARRATREASVAAHERDRARVEAAKAERINAFLQSIFASADPSWYSTGHGQRGEVKVVDVLEQAGRRIDSELKDEPEIRAELHHTIGTTFQSLGQFEQAHTHFRAALDAYRGLYGERHTEVAEALYYLAASMYGRGDYAGALALFRQSLEMFRAVDPNNANVPYLLADFASLLNGTGETVAAEQAVREGLEIARQRYGDEHVLTLSLLGMLGSIYEARGDLRQAETSYQTVLAAYNGMPNGRLLSSGWLENLGRLSMFKGELKQAEAQYREAFDISHQTLNETNPQHINLLLMLAEIHYHQGAYADTEKEATSALDLLRRNESRNSHHQLRGLSLLSLTHAKTNRRASASAFLGEALTMFNSLPDADRYQDDGLLGEALIALKREAEARPLLLKRYAFFARTHGEQNPQAVITRQQLERLDATTRNH
ncbi:MAG: eukaryotic-like serine/threonine-protein kinase [Acidobacteriota bacterium]|nr:eukaryotic-like serine/threonine-protein kinase [Acidobacteriota bacterium]